MGLDVRLLQSIKLLDDLSLPSVSSHSLRTRKKEGQL